MKAAAVFYMGVAVVMLVICPFVNNPDHLAMLYGGAIMLIFTAGICFYAFALDFDLERMSLLVGQGEKKKTRI